MFIYALIIPLAVRDEAVLQLFKTVFTGEIIQFQSRRERNANYKASSWKESNFGKQILNSMSSRDFQYYLVSNVDVEVSIITPRDKLQVTHIERVEYRVPLTSKVDERQLQSEAPVTAAVDAVRAAMLRYGLPVTMEIAEVEKKEKPPSIFSRFLKIPDGN